MILEHYLEEEILPVLGVLTYESEQMKYPTITVIFPVR
jgi:hypothetical protein